MAGTTGAVRTYCNTGSVEDVHSVLENDGGIGGRSVPPGAVLPLRQKVGGYPGGFGSGAAAGRRQSKAGTENGAAWDR